MSDPRYPLSKAEASKRASAMLRALRQRRGFTPKQLAEHLGVDINSIYRWENKRLPFASVILINWLFSENGSEVYWRERALLAEESMRVVSAELIKYSRDIHELRNT